LNRLQVPFHAVSALFFHLVGNVTVHIKGKAGGGVTEIALQRLNVITGTERGNGEAVTQIVKASVGAPDLSDNTLELSVDGGLCQMLPCLAGKDKPSFTPRNTKLQVVRDSRCSVTLQLSQHGGSHGNAAALVVFRRDELIRLQAALLMKLQLLFDKNHTTVKIDTIPC